MGLPQISSAGLILAGILFLYVAFSIYKKFGAQRKRQPPEAPGGWPVVGHLHLLSATEPIQLTLAKMADAYGPIFTLRLGMKKALVVSNWKIARECFTTNDKIFASRPKIAAGKLLGYDYALIGTTLSGPLRTHMRKIATHELLSSHRLEQLKHIRISEVESSMKGLYELWHRRRRDNGRSDDKVLAEMKTWFGELTLNTIFRMVTGERFSRAFKGDDGEKYKKAMRDVIDLFGLFVPGDWFPFLRWLDIGGHEKAMMKTAKVLDEMLKRWLKEHRQKGSLIEMDVEEFDFMDVMLSLVKDDEQLSSYDDDDDRITKATCLSMMLGGFETTSITMQWALALLLNNPEALKTLQFELDEQVGQGRKVEESDVKNLLYLQAVVKETLRLYPAVPIAFPHESIKNCIVADYHVSTQTRLLVNLQKLHRDPLVWEDPNEFRPERFLSRKNHFDVRGQHPQLIPFGSGRMMCPGISFALQIVSLTLAKLLHTFEVGRPSNELINMEMGVGVTCIRKNPLEIALNPRLPPQAYEYFYENVGDRKNGTS
ncbi:cytochrome P450 CYP82D47-like [Benincasa hispida]|uniref:cytochrome P450 CYP82D47-like n=1 Tax=Benincasa hispida TaxID=102211 RepID=UPI0018FF3443|nr:cytochrome P450 CYP82D47-like [Benincasa hispida]